MFWSITWNIMKRHSICAEIGLKIEDTVNNITSTTVWATIMNILYIIYGVFILSQVEKSLSTITRRTLKQNWYISVGKGWTKYYHWSICFWKSAIDCLSKLSDFGKSQIVCLMMMPVWIYKCVCGPQFNNRNLSLTKGNRPSYKSSITCNNNSKFTHHQGRFGPERPNDKKL